MKLAKYLANLGYGSRRQVAAMIERGRVTTLAGEAIDGAESIEHGDILVNGEPLDPPPRSVIMMSKPVGYACTTVGSTPTIYDLLPERFRARRPVMASVGRLDLDTSGLLLLTDDGQVNHRVTSPRTHLRKVYEVTLATDLRGDEREIFASGSLMLESDAEPLHAATLEALGPRHARLTVTEGRYHQARRMFAAVGNHVTTLHRSAVGGLELSGVEPGQWRVLNQDDKNQLFRWPSSDR